MHWNLPSNPVDFEQREGRVDRYKGHAIRKNVAARLPVGGIGPTESLTPGTLCLKPPPAEDGRGLGDLTPYWVYPGDALLQRRIMALPLSRDEERWVQLQESLALYRLAFGQPRQEDMLAALRRRGFSGQTKSVDEIRIDLTPPAISRESLMVDPGN